MWSLYLRFGDLFHPEDDTSVGEISTPVTTATPKRVSTPVVTKQSTPTPPPPTPPAPTPPPATPPPTPPPATPPPSPPPTPSATPKAKATSSPARGPAIHQASISVDDVFDHKKSCGAVDEERVKGAVFTVNMQTQKKDEDGEWEKRSKSMDLKAEETGIFVIDPWNHHWCKEAESRLEQLYREKMNKYLLLARIVGVHVLMFPHHAMKPYQKWQQYLKTKKVPRVPLPRGELRLKKHPFKCNDCCNDASVKPKTHKVWTAIHPLISICEDDVINIEPVEVYRWLKHKKIKNLLFLGGATNQCILNRDFGMKHFCLPSYGFKCMLIKDMTETAVGKDSVDNILKPGKRLTPEEAESLMFDYYERHVVPTILSHEVLHYRLPESENDEGDDSW